MGRFIQGLGRQGSQKHLQRLVNGQTDSLNRRIRQALNLGMGEEISWKSPLASDDYAEYRDQAFLVLLGLQGATQNHPLSDFWPENGPQWDALARTSEQKIILVEAKSHIQEMDSTCAATSPASIQKIGRALNSAKAYFGSQTQNDWSARYYQYANRLAHLYWLRALNGVDAHLVFIYFVNDSQMGGPESEHEWESAIKVVHDYLGVSALLPHVHSLFIDVAFVG